MRQPARQRSGESVHFVVDRGSFMSLVIPKAIKMVFTTSLLGNQHEKDGEKKQQLSSHVVSLEKQLKEFLHFNVAVW